MHGYLFGPIKKSEVITLANVNFFSANSSIASDPEERVTIVPGLLANGSPTTNSQLSLDRSEISSNSNFDYIVTVSEVNNE
jgi:hypothetical protein